MTYVTYDRVTSDYIGNPNIMYAFALSRTQDASLYLDQLGNLTAALTPPVITPVFPTGGDVPTPVVVDTPTFNPITWAAPVAPSTFVGSLEVDDLMPEPFEETAPLLSFGAAPTFSELAPDAPPINFTFEDPELSLDLPSVPSLLSLNITAFAGMDLPTAISSDIPELTVGAPSAIAYEPGASYTSSLLSLVQTSLTDRITNGGTGLNAAAENAIWERGREREYRQKADAILALEQMESMGYALPPGGYVDARLKIETEMAAQIAGHSREVMIKQAELELENVKQALTLANTLESILIQNHNNQEQRNFEAARYATQAGIEIYNARVKAYAAYLDAFKTRVQIYEAQIRGEMAKVEAYKAQVEAESAKAQVNTSLVQQYKAQVEAAMSGVEIYKARIQGIQTKASIEKLKVEVFGEQVKAYGAKVNAYSAGVEAFKGLTQAEATKQEAFKAQVQAYTAIVDAQVKQITARIEAFKGQIAVKNAEWDGYKAVVTGETARVQGLAAVNQALADAYRAEVQGASSYNDTITKQWQVALDQAQRVSEIGISAAKANAELYMTTRSIATDAAKVGAQVSAQLGAAAINAINWSTSVSLSDSTSKVNQSSLSEIETTTISG
jgi:hypothetical protein